MEIKKFILNRKKDFNNSVCLSSIIPILVFIYILVTRFSSLNVFNEETGLIILATLLVFVSGILVGKAMLKSWIEELIEKNRLAAITETTLTLSHEINNPLLTISGNLELMETDQLPQEVKERLDTVKSGFQRIREATDKLTHLSKPVSEPIHGSIKMINIEKSQGI